MLEIGLKEISNKTSIEKEKKFKKGKKGFKELKEVQKK